MSDWKRENSDLVNQFEETKVELGSKIVSWMKNINFVKIKLITKGKKDRCNILIPTDMVLKTLNNKNKLIALPRRLPMLVKPKLYYREIIDGVVRERLAL